MDYITRAKEIADEAKPTAESMYKQFEERFIQLHADLPVGIVKSACRIAWVNVRF